MKRLLACVVLGLALTTSIATRVPAQMTPTEESREPRLPAMVPLAGTIDPTRYRLGPGDVLRLALFGPISRQSTLVVAPEGTLILPDLGAVRVSGLTLDEARAAVSTRIRGALRGVGVEMQLVVPRSFRVYVTGEVRMAGPRIATATSRLIDLLPDTLLTAMSSQRNIEVRSLDGRVWIGDLERFRMAGEGQGDQALSDGDVVHVPVARRFVGAWGGVGRPGRYELGPADSVGTLLRLAGGPREGALAERALLLRWQGSKRDSQWVSLRDPGAAGLGMALLESDELHLFSEPDYRVSERAGITGRVAVNGDFPIQTGQTRLSSLLAMAGGVLPDADSASVLLYRARPAAGPDPEFERLSRLARGEMTGSEYETFRTRLAGLTPDFRVDLRTLRANSANDPRLVAGDLVMVSRSVRAIRVDGQVRRPGVVEYEPGRPYSWYIKATGGYTTRSARGQVRITRASSGQTLMARETDVPLAGDFLWVPERSDVPAWQYLRDTFLLLGQIATVIIALRR